MVAHVEAEHERLQCCQVESSASLDEAEVWAVVVEGGLVGDEVGEFGEELRLYVKALRQPSHLKALVEPPRG